MYITMKYQFILHDKIIMRITSNQPPIPCFKHHKMWRLPTNQVNHCLLFWLLHVAVVFSTFAWLWMFLAEFVLVFRSLFRYCGARGKFLTLKNIVCFTHKQTVFASGDPHKAVISYWSLKTLRITLGKPENTSSKTESSMSKSDFFIELPLIRLQRIEDAEFFTTIWKIYREVVGMHFVYSVVKDFRGCFKGEFWRFIVLLFHLEAIYLPVLKSLVHMYEMW